jgi:hypothetical protein
MTMTIRKKLGSGIERLELRAAPSTLIGTGVSLAPRPGTGLDNQFEAPASISATHSTSEAIFAARSVASKGISGGTEPHAGLRSANQDESEVRNFPTGTEVIEGASSTLRRSPNGISWTFKTNELQAGHAYTLWVVAFNNPDACVDGCGLDDLARPDVATTLAFGGGHVVGPSQSATFSGHLREGDASGFPLDSPFAGVVGGEHLGLVDAAIAEIHLVIRDHGEVIPGRVSEQIGTFSGACDVNACANVQFAAHQP